MRVLPLDRFWETSRVSATRFDGILAKRNTLLGVVKKKKQLLGSWESEFSKWF
jgi:hypothetical protein